MKIKIIIYLLLSTSAMHAKVLLWDLGGVLFYPNKWGVAQTIGLSYFLSYMVFDGRNPNLQDRLFKILALMEKPDAAFKECAGTAEGTPLPTIMCRWQEGTITGPEIIKKASNHIKQLDKLDYFESEHERALVIRTIRAMFDPETLARNCHPLAEGMQLVKECALAQNKDGTKKHRNIAFSNWDHLSFDKCRQLNRWHFRYFEDVIISGHIKLIKPRKESYEYVLKKHNLNPSDCIIIDDQKCNIEGARKCGIKTIHVKNCDFKKLRADLKAAGVL